MPFGILGVDIGGTFTDFVYAELYRARIITLKVPSTPDNPAQAVFNGIRELVDLNDVDLDDIHYFVHGTTLGANTVIQRNGALTGLLVTKGFRDLLEIGRLRLPDPTNYFVEKVPPLVRRQLVREVDERLLASGEILTPLNREQLHGEVEFLVQHGVEAITVSFMHSYRNPIHELQALEYIRQYFPEIYICGSAEIWPQQREYERTMVAVINAFIGPAMSSYLSRLREGADSVGLGAPTLTTKSNGGIMTAAAAKAAPVETLLSGPASGVIGARHIARKSGFKSLITFDMGGTSAEAAVIEGDVPYSTESAVGDFPVVLPAVDIRSVGSGGGSVAWVDSSGVLKVGPRSTGAKPGPACYGAGGVEPTVTDAYVLLGVISPEHFLGGKAKINRDLAADAMLPLAKSLGLSLDESAASILQVTTASLQAKMMPLFARRGIDTEDFAMIVYGGAGPTHGLLLARELGINTVIIPPSPGTLCAMGCLVADLRQDFIKTLNTPMDALTATSLEAEFEILSSKGSDWLSAQRAPMRETVVTRNLDMRYEGQSFDINIQLPTSPAKVSLEEIGELFHTTYERLYGFAERQAPIRIIDIRLAMLGIIEKPQSSTGTVGSGVGAARGSRLIHTDGNDVNIDAQVYERRFLSVDQEFAGPAIVESGDTTAYIPAGYRARIDEQLSIVANRAGEAW
jgi:N-methylhydantoinase A